MPLDFIEKHHRLSDPVASCGDQLYIICTQNGLFPDSWATDHSPHEMEGVWAHPIKLLDGYWVAIRSHSHQITSWLSEATCCRVYATHTEFDYRVGPLQITRRDLVPDGQMGFIVTITIQAPPSFSHPPSPSDAASVERSLHQHRETSEQGYQLWLSLRSDLRPAWLGEEVGIVDGPDHALAEPSGSWVAFGDANNPWSLIVGAAMPATRILTDETTDPFQQTHGQGANATLVLPLRFDANGQAQQAFVFAASLTSSTEAIDRFEHLLAEHPNSLAQKQATYQAIAQQSQLVSPNVAINEAFHWSKINCQWLARDVSYFYSQESEVKSQKSIIQNPKSKIQNHLAAAAGLPSYPWWFGIDNEYAVLPMVQAGLFELTLSTLRMLKRVSEQHNPTEPGRVIHELASTGVVYNPGNMVETPIFTRAVYQTWCWTGDADFLAEMYPFCKAGLLEYSLGICDPDGDLCPAGRSVIETLEMHAGFECIDPAVYTWEALHCLVEMAQAMGDQAIIPDLQSKAATLGQRILQEWWLPDQGLFADLRASISEVKRALAKLDEWAAKSQDADFLRQHAESHRLFAAALAERSDQPTEVDLHWLLRHWVVMCPAEVGLATPTQAAQLFERLESDEFCNQHGMMLHPKRADVMSINTGLLALAEARYGRTQQALRWVETMAAMLNLRTPGAISEALPDQWCFVQLWSALGILSPVVECFLGIQPNAPQRTLRIVPKLPDGWDRVELRRLRVGEDHFDIQVEQTDRQSIVRVQGSAAYRLSLGVYLPEAAHVIAVSVNDTPVDWHWEDGKAGRAVCCVVHPNAEFRVEWSLNAN